MAVDLANARVDRATLTAAADYHAALRRYARWFGAARDECADIVQDVFARFSATGFAYRSQPELRAFLRNMVRHEVLARRRREARTGRIAPVRVDELFVATEAERPARHEALARCLEQLPERTRTVLHLVYGEGLPHAEAAARVGLGPEGIKSLLRRTKDRLRACVRTRMENRDD